MNLQYFLVKDDPIFVMKQSKTNKEADFKGFFYIVIFFVAIYIFYRWWSSKQKPHQEVKAKAKPLPKKTNKKPAKKATKAKALLENQQQVSVEKAIAAQIQQQKQLRGQQQHQEEEYPREWYPQEEDEELEEEQFYEQRYKKMPQLHRIPERIPVLPSSMLHTPDPERTDPIMDNSMRVDLGRHGDFNLLEDTVVTPMHYHKNMKLLTQDGFVEYGEPYDQGEACGDPGTDRHLYKVYPGEKQQISKSIGYGTPVRRFDNIRY